MGVFILLFLALGALEFFLVTRPGKWRFFAVILPAAAFFFWMDRQAYWTAAGPGDSMGYSLELMIVGVWAAASIIGAAAGLFWDWKKNKK